MKSWAPLAGRSRATQTANPLQGCPGGTGFSRSTRAAQTGVDPVIYSRRGRLDAPTRVFYSTVSGDDPVSARFPEPLKPLAACCSRPAGRPR